MPDDSVVTGRYWQAHRTIECHNGERIAPGRVSAPEWLPITSQAVEMSFVLMEEHHCEESDALGVELRGPLAAASRQVRSAATTASRLLPSSRIRRGPSAA